MSWPFILNLSRVRWPMTMNDDREERLRPHKHSYIHTYVLQHIKTRHAFAIFFLLLIFDIYLYWFFRFTYANLYNLLSFFTVMITIKPDGHNEKTGCNLMKRGDNWIFNRKKSKRNTSEGEANDIVITDFACQNFIFFHSFRIPSFSILFTLFLIIFFYIFIS